MPNISLSQGEEISIGTADSISYSVLFQVDDNGVFTSAEVLASVKGVQNTYTLDAATLATIFSNKADLDAIGAALHGHIKTIVTASPPTGEAPRTAKRAIKKR